MVFIAMKFFEINANIVALSGIAIAIGTMVDVGVILSDNIMRHIRKNNENTPINTVVYNASIEVSGAIITAVLTTIVSFIPVFSMTGAEGKLFNPLAFTKTAALFASIFLTLFLIPPFSAFLFQQRRRQKSTLSIINGIIVLFGLYSIISGYWLALTLVGFGATRLFEIHGKITNKTARNISISLAIITVLALLSEYWRPLGVRRKYVFLTLFLLVLCALVF